MNKGVMREREGENERKKMNNLQNMKERVMINAAISQYLSNLFFF